MGIKNIFGIPARKKWTAAPSLFLFVWLASAMTMTGAAQLQDARVTQIIHDVKLLPGQAAARPAVVNDSVSAGMAVRTGTDSRTELTFSDLTITRMGANTVFSYNQGARELQLTSGAMLVQVPRNGADVKVSTAAVTAAISGGTALMESNKGLPTKLLVLEGITRFYPKGHPEQAVIVHGGEMAMAIDGRITKPTKFDAALVYKTAKLITSFPELPNADLIMAVIEEQQMEMADQPSNPPDQSIDTRDLAIAASLPSAAGGGSPKFGRPAVITSPNPYLITSGTVINTDPTITTAGITDFGKIYRGEGKDGALATWLGVSPIPFDGVDFFDNTGGGFNNPDSETLPIPAFLFVGLRLDGDPTVSNSNNYPTLGLFSQADINTSPSGTAFSFGGMPQVALVSLKGSISLAGMAFSNFGELFVYARGDPGGTITLEAPITNLEKVTLRAVQDVIFNAPITVNKFKALAGNNLQTSSTTNANQITLQSLGGITVASSAQLLAMVNSTGSGQIVIIASGSDTAANIGGTVQADQGEIDIRQTGVAGQVTLNSATLHGDIIKVSALGTNGVLNIGSGNALNADTILKLYATGSNGTLNFLSDVTLTSPRNILAANTINIAQGVVVTISNIGNIPADVFTNNPNYFGFGGTGQPANSGTFGGAGAKDPLQLGGAPPLGPPGGGQ